MSAVAEERKIIKGGSFLIEERTPEEIFTPEDFTEEQRMIAETTREFIDNEVRPRIPELEKHDWALARELVKKSAELGLVGAVIPEEYGGLGLDQTSGTLVAENFGRAASFAVTFGAQTGIGTLPIVYFGNEETKKKYLPRIVTGEVIPAYALTEAGSGSDALAAKATARLSEDGKHYVLKGEKMWITNGGFADVFVVFAKVDGEHFTAFIVERAFKGVSNGKEEHKMGLHGSSTTPVILQDVHVPAENLLGEVGKGHKVAFNVLNFGRFKLGAMCSGGGQGAIGEAARYAAERKQFGQPIASFGAIKHKLGQMTAWAYAVESMMYRTAGYIDARIESTPHEPADGSAALAAL